MEVKGLRQKALAFRQNLEKLHKAYDTFNDQAPAHVASVEAVTDQILTLQSDLEFATQMLGNSAVVSEPPPQPPPASNDPIKTEPPSGRNF